MASALNPCRQDTSERGLADVPATDGPETVTAADLDVLLGAVLSRLAGCVATVAPGGDAAQAPQCDVQMIRATVLECVGDLESLRRSLADPALSPSATDAWRCNDGRA
jgi:hypothetical protein